MRNFWFNTIVLASGLLCMPLLDAQEMPELVGPGAVIYLCSQSPSQCKIIEDEKYTHIITDFLCDGRSSYGKIYFYGTADCPGHQRARSSKRVSE